MISASSSWIYLDSIGWPRTDARALAAFSSLPVVRLAARSVKLSLILLTLLCVETWGLRKKEQAKTDDDCPEELNSDRDSIGARVETILSCIHDTVCEKNTDCDAKLVAGDEGT